MHAAKGWLSPTIPMGLVCAMSNRPGITPFFLSGLTPKGGVLAKMTQ